MTDHEISKALALAIGWPQVLTFSWGVMVREGNNAAWRDFDYREWSVIAPIAERFNCFPYQHKPRTGVPDGKWVVWPNTLEDTPQRAIAMAVINGATK